MRKLKMTLLVAAMLPLMFGASAQAGTSSSTQPVQADDSSGATALTGTPQIEALIPNQVSPSGSMCGYGTQLLSFSGSGAWGGIGGAGVWGTIVSCQGASAYKATFVCPAGYMKTVLGDFSNSSSSGTNGNNNSTYIYRAYTCIK